jgi:hypothetical protein
MKLVAGRGLAPRWQAYETCWVAAPAAVRFALRAHLRAIAPGAPNLPAVE